MGRLHTLLVYFGLEEETEEERREFEDAPPLPWRFIVRYVVATLVIGTVVVGVGNTLLDGHTVTVRAVLREGFLHALVLSIFWAVVLVAIRLGSARG
jgi:hypothetical protein